MKEQNIEFPDERAYMYDDPDLRIMKTDPKKKHWDRWINRYKKCIQLTGRSGGKWLDAACGSGYGTEIISVFAGSVIGADVDSKTIAYAKKHHGSNANIDFINKDILDFSSWEKNKFDVVISIETIEHMLDAEPFFKQVFRLLKTDGLFVVTTPESQVGGGKNPNNQFHLNEYTYDQFSNILKSTFCEVVISAEKAIFTTGLETVQMYAVCKVKK